MDDLTPSTNRKLGPYVNTNNIKAKLPRYLQELYWHTFSLYNNEASFQEVTVKTKTKSRDKVNQGTQLGCWRVRWLDVSGNNMGRLTIWYPKPVYMVTRGKIGWSGQERWKIWWVKIMYWWVYLIKNYFIPLDPKEVSSTYLGTHINHG